MVDRGVEGVEANCGSEMGTEYATALEAGAGTEAGG